MKLTSAPTNKNLPSSRQLDKISPTKLRMKALTEKVKRRFSSGKERKKDLDRAKWLDNSSRHYSQYPHTIHISVAHGRHAENARKPHRKPERLKRLAAKLDLRRTK